MRILDGARGFLRCRSHADDETFSPDYLRILQKKETDGGGPSGWPEPKSNCGNVDVIPTADTAGEVRVATGRIQEKLMKPVNVLSCSTTRPMPFRMVRMPMRGRSVFMMITSIGWLLQRKALVSYSPTSDASMPFPSRKLSLGFPTLNLAYRREISFLIVRFGFKT